MNDFKEGLIGAIVGVVGAIMFSSIATSFAQDDKLKDSIWIFTLIGLAGTISTIFIFKTAGFIFNIGWIIGAWLVKDAMDTSTFLIFFIAPIVILILRIFFLVKNSNGS